MEPIATSYCDVKMYLDTGSSLTSINEKVATDLGINLHGLDTQSIGGIGAIKNTPIFRNVSLYFLLEGGTPHGVTLEKIAIHPDKISDVKHKNDKNLKRKVTTSFEMVSLFGIDALEKIGGELVINAKNKSGYIDLNPVH